MKNFEFPKKAVITGGMPYGNKPLHFGHIGGYFIQADVFARFLKDRIGEENVIFVSGTDCYGSPIVASYREDTTSDTMEAYVEKNHLKQKKVIAQYQISPSLFAASAFGSAAESHRKVSAKLFEDLYDKGMIEKHASYQFYDSSSETYLNGRQVVGRCPIEGCRSEKAFADECDLGHQYMPEELIDPVSTLSDTTPELRSVENWYFNLPAYRDKIAEMIEALKREKKIRPNVYAAMEEFLKEPAIYIKRSLHEEIQMQELYDELHDDGKKPSVTYVYRDLASRDRARQIMDEQGINYRTGKTLVPFRLSGNIEWGVPVPEKEGMKDLTFWVWPESLWAPISFTMAYLESQGEDPSRWKEWWLSDDSAQYQFIGEDNIYFYAIAEMGLWMAYRGIMPNDKESLSISQVPEIIANFHLLFMDKKASSSGAVKPPLACELLEYYTVDQLRMHFMSLGLSKKSVSFSPKVLQIEDTKGEDPVLKDGNVLTNVLNRILRSIFYTAQKYTHSSIPAGTPSEEIADIVKKGVFNYERNMHRHEFHMVLYAVDDLIRKTSKHWAKYSKDTDDYTRALTDCFYACRVILTLLHPMTPISAELARKKMNLPTDIWSWENMDDLLLHEHEHMLQQIPPKFDFFEKHPRQLKEVENK